MIEINIIIAIVFFVFGYVSCAIIKHKTYELWKDEFRLKIYNAAIRLNKKDKS